MLSALDGAVPGGDSGTRIGEQVIYLGDDSRKEEKGFQENEIKAGESRCQGTFRGAAVANRSWI